MTVLKTGVLMLQTDHDIVVCRQEVRRLAQELKFSLVDQTRVVTATSELARNALIHGGGGKMHWSMLQEGARFGLKLEFIDYGPGIADVSLAMKDGWSTGSGMGIGLPGAKRLVSEFKIESTVGVGTRVTVTRWGTPGSALRR